MTNLFKKYTVFLVFSMLFSLATFASGENPDIQNFVDSWRKQNKVPGVVLFISTPNSRDFFTSGTTQLNGHVPVTKDTLFAIGSLTKSFTSAMILRLEAQGKLTINDKIGTYFPQYPRWNDITIKQLLNMTSGIVNFTQDPLWVKNLQNNFKETWSRNQIINSAYQQNDYFKPGQAWRYSNTNYVLLAEIIESKTQQPLSKTFEEQFFKPLGLNNSYYSENKYSKDILDKTAHGYDNNHDMTTSILANNVSNIGPPGGGMLMSTIDLEKWIDHLLIKKDILPKQQLNEMLTGVVMPDSKFNLPNQKFGLGLGIASGKKTGENISYAGTFPGYGSTFVWLPEKNVLIIVQMNVNRFDSDESSSNLHFPNQTLIQGILDKIVPTT